MIKYKAEWYYSAQLTRCEVEKETDKCIWINGNRNAKVSQGVMFYDTFEEAQQRLIQECEDKLKRCQQALSRAEDNLAEIKALELPK